ncbi:MAG: hypothetical protein VW496_05035 [Pelagibacteraceae bacterium]
MAVENYPCQVEFDLYFLKGNLKGCTHTDKMGFMSWNDAYMWASSVTISSKVDYVVLEMRNLKTGEVVNF